jgi:hypothetical protein
MRKFVVVLFFAMMSAGYAGELKPLMCEQGKLLMSEDFTVGPLSQDWKVAKGKWDVVDGTLKGAELDADHHPAVLDHALKCHNLIAQFSFKFAGGKSMALSFNNTNGHVCRVTITPAGFTVQKDKAGKNTSDQPAKLDAVKYTFTPGEWYTMLVEICGREMLARVDDKNMGFGSNDGVDVDKTSVRFPVAGDSVFIKNLRIWEAQIKSDWDATKKKLKTDHPQQPAETKK